MNNIKQSPAMITELAENEIFVFGSNLQGMHNGGAARLALKWGAVMGQGVGIQGQTYAIPTMSGSVSGITPYVDEFIAFAKSQPTLKFLVTEIGCGIAGYTPEQIAPLFANAYEAPNIYLPQRFISLIEANLVSSDNILERVGICNTYKITDNFYAGEYPGAKSEEDTKLKIEQFEKAGINNFIDLTKDGELTLYDKYLSTDTHHNRFPINDVSVPSDPSVADEIVNMIDTLLSIGRKVYIHCWGGVGRTGTIVACYFVFKGNSAEVALQKLAMLWKTCKKSKRKPNSPETQEQREFVYKYAEYINEKRRKLSQIKGSMLGGAIGDALGYAVEFSSIDAIHAHYGDNGITRYQLNNNGNAEISDDTQMTLFTAVALIAALTRVRMRGIGGSTENYIWQFGYIPWLKTQQYPNSNVAYSRDDNYYPCWIKHIDSLYSRRAPGLTCLSAISGENKGSIEIPINNSKGCGGVMRVAPFGLIQNCYASATTIINEGAKTAATTHGHPLGYIPAGMLSHLIWNIINKKHDSLKKAVEESFVATREHFKDSEYISAFCELIITAHDLSSREDDDIAAIKQLGEGWVAEEALAIAIYCALKYSDNFEKAIIAAVNHSGDSDSTGAICGNIIGAYLGVNSIPEYYLEKLELRDIITEVSEDLYHGCIISEYNSGNTYEQRRWWTKYGEGEVSHYNDYIAKNQFMEDLQASKKKSTGGLVWKLEKVQFFKSDIEKMKNMTDHEKNNFANKLKEEGRYVVITPED